jgi:hypothetical protein
MMAPSKCGSLDLSAGSKNKIASMSDSHTSLRDMPHWKYKLESDLKQIRRIKDTYITYMASLFHGP